MTRRRGTRLFEILEECVGCSVEERVGVGDDKHLATRFERGDLRGPEHRADRLERRGRDPIAKHDDIVGVEGLGVGVGLEDPSAVSAGTAGAFGPVALAQESPREQRSGLETIFIAATVQDHRRIKRLCPRHADRVIEVHRLSGLTGAFRLEFRFAHGEGHPTGLVRALGRSGVWVLRSSRCECVAAPVRPAGGNRA